MKHKKVITLLVIVTIILSLFAAVPGVLSGTGQAGDDVQFQSINGENVKLHGKGLYKNDSYSMAAQAIAQDYVTLFIGIPFLLVSLVLARKKQLKGRLLLTGVVGYFLYTYTSYAFLSMYNELFLIYVAAMSVSFFAFILCVTGFDLEALKQAFHSKTPVKFIGGFQIFLAFVIFMMWIGRIVPSLAAGAVPMGLEHYTTLVIQALDLGIIVPTAALSGVLIIKRKPIGYLLSSVIIIKGFSLLTALTAMIIGQLLAGVEIGIAEIVTFPLFNIISLYSLMLILKNVDEQHYNNIQRSHSV